MQIEKCSMRKLFALQTFYRGADLIAAQLHGLPVRVLALAERLRLFDVVAVALVDDSHDGRACARDERAECAELLGLADDVLAVFDEAEAVGLMQAVPGRDVQDFPACRWSAPREQRRTREVVDRVVVVDALRERRTRIFGGKLKVRDKDHEVDRAVNRHADVADVAVFEQRHAEAAEDGRSRVVRVALDGGRKVDDRVAVEPARRAGRSRHDAGDRAGRGRTQTARRGIAQSSMMVRPESGLPHSS